MSIPPIVALEVGTTRIRALVGEARDDGQLMVTGLGEVRSRGVRKSEIVDMDMAQSGVRKALEQAEKTGQVAVNQVHLVVSGGHLQGLVNRGSVPVIDGTGEIMREDMEHAMETARAVNLPPDRVTLHTICQRFYVDDQHAVINPEGMEGSKLSVDMLILHGLRGRLRNTVKVVRNLALEVQDVAFGGLCSALAVLSKEQKEQGILVIDLGGGTTDFVVYARNAIAWAGSLAVGGDHITNDIAHGLRITTGQAEKLKEECGSALVNMSVRGQRVAVPLDVGAPDRFVPVSDLHTIIHMRADEIFRMIKNVLIKQDLLHLLGAGVVLTGGGAFLTDVNQLASRVFGLPCSMGHPRNISGLATATDGPGFSTPLGMIRYGFATSRRERRSGSLRDLFRGLFVR
jgi:cell division protein FtsA